METNDMVEAKSATAHWNERGTNTKEWNQRVVDGNRDAGECSQHLAATALQPPLCHGAILSWRHSMPTDRDRQLNPSHTEHKYAAEGTDKPAQSSSHRTQRCRRRHRQTVD